MNTASCRRDWKSRASGWWTLFLDISYFPSSFLFSRSGWWTTDEPSRFMQRLKPCWNIEALSRAFSIFPGGLYRPGGFQSADGRAPEGFARRVINIKITIWIQLSGSTRGRAPTPGGQQLERLGAIRRIGKRDFRKGEGYSCALNLYNNHPT